MGILCFLLFWQIFNLVENYQMAVLVKSFSLDYPLFDIDNLLRLQKQEGNNEFQFTYIISVGKNALAAKGLWRLGVRKWRVNRRVLFLIPKAESHTELHLKRQVEEARHEFYELVKTSSPEFHIFLHKQKKRLRSARVAFNGAMLIYYFEQSTQKWNVAKATRIGAVKRCTT